MADHSDDDDNNNQISDSDGEQQNTAKKNAGGGENLGNHKNIDANAIDGKTGDRETGSELEVLAHELEQAQEPPSGHQTFPTTVFPKTWRSEIQGLTIFIILIATCVALSLEFPKSIIVGRLVTVAGYRIMLALPLFWLIPAWWLSVLAFRIYNVRFSANDRGLEAIEGILSLNQHITRVRYEDVRSLEMDQTLIERLLNVGDLEIGTAGTQGVEIMFEGVGNPFVIKDIIQARQQKREFREDFTPHSAPEAP